MDISSLVDSVVETLSTDISKSQIILSVTALVVGLLLYWLGPVVIRWMSSHMLVRPGQRKMHKKDLEKRRNTVSSLASNIWRIVVILCTLYAVFIQFFDAALLSPLFASAGIIGVALGFGAQSLVKDFLSGVFIISENQYRVGDVVEIEGFGGSVERIGVRSTVLRDADGNVHYFPNGMVQHVINKTMDYSMARFTLTVAPDSDIDKIIKIVNNIGMELVEEDTWKKKIIEPPQFVMMGDFTANAVNLIVSGKTQPSDQWSVVAEMRQRILVEFDKAGIKLGAEVPLSALKQRK